MFKKLRLKFTLLTSTISFITLFVIGLSLNTILYFKTTSRLKEDAIVALKYPLEEQEKNDGPNDKNNENLLKRFFFITLNNNSYTYYRNNMFPLNQNELATLSNNIFKGNKNDGFYNYFYFYKSNNTAVVLDARSEKEAINSTYIISTFICLSAFVLITTFSFLFSKKVIRPYEKNYESQRRFLTDASHELKTPLAIISANLDVLESENENNKWVNSSQEQISRMRNLINEMVSLNKIEELNGNTKKEKFNMSDSLLEAIESYESLSIDNNIKFTYNVPENIIYDGDESLILKLYGIFLDNAFKYVSKDGWIHISLKDNKKKVVLIFSNSVEDVDEEKLKYCFDRFYTLDESRSKSRSGFGIGLSIAQAIVKEHNGEIKTYLKDNNKSIYFEIILKK